MILPITAYGHPTLRKVAEEIDAGHPGLDELIENMFETMYTSSGVGLAAPQVNQSIRLFIVDATPYAEDYPEVTEFKKVFINPYILEESGEEWSFNEGCLSVPGVREDIIRKPKILLEYQDKDFNIIEETYEGVMARIIQHEYDHIEGTIFVEKVSPLRKVLLKRKLNDISTGNIDVDYKMIFPLKPKKRK
ncbi:MAG: peptide deformylase [Bacteroidetes bacterium]|nr:MAG: peptide deformylase [Bacteroidota bacterium]RLD81003.1 MAG: peptide deformylase [Bacteroidota bacterium]